MRKLPAHALLLAPLLLLAGACTVGPDFAAPAAPPPGQGYGATGGSRVVLGEAPGAQWWRALGSPVLDALVERALDNNHSLAASLATLQAARERINAAAGRRLPQVDLSGRSEYQQVNFAAFGFDGLAAPGQRISNPRFDLYTIGGGVSYDLDLFGRNRRALEQAAAEAEAQQRQTEAAHLIVAGRVVAQVLAIAAFNDRIATQRALLAEDERNFDLTEKRRRAGAGTMVEVLSAQGQLAADRAALPALEQQLAEGRGMLAVLLGISPAELGPTDFTLDQFTVPAQVPVALPSTLVHVRPDILEAEARLHAATAQVGVATAQLYPDLTIGASLTQSTTEPQRILSDNFSAYDIFAGLSAPIFHGGTLKANRRGAEANARAAAETYRQVVLEAFAQVAGLLSAIETDGRALAAERDAAGVAERSLYLSRRSFEVGNSGILQVLEANRAFQRARLALLEARTRQYYNVARLIVATAGGWTGRPGTAAATAPEAAPPS